MTQPAAKKCKQSDCEDKIKQKLICTGCKQLMLGNIYQCDLNHIYCTNCLSYNNMCKVCNTLINKTARLMFLEELRDCVEILCENKGCKTDIIKDKNHKEKCEYNYCVNEGCDFHGTRLQLFKHETICKFRTITCCMEECKKTLCMKDLKTHIINDHKRTFKDASNSTSQLTVPKSNDVVFQIIGYNNSDILVFKIEKKDNEIEINVKPFLTGICTLTILLKYNDIIEGVYRTFPNSIISSWTSVIKKQIDNPKQLEILYSFTI